MPGKTSRPSGPKTSRRSRPGSPAGLAVAAGLVAGCLPEAPPPWQVDHTIVAALQFEVATRGPWGSPSSRPDRRVAEVMPGDEIRVVPLVIGPDGPVAAASLRPRYFLCAGLDCVPEISAPGGVRDCEDEEVIPPTATCELRGDRLRLGPPRQLLQATSIFMIAGGAGGPSTNECLARLRRTREGSLRACLLVVETLQLGPTWRLLVMAASLGLADAVPLTTITPAVTAAPANEYPGAPALTVRVTDPGEPARTLAVESGETLAVARGAEVEVVAEVDPEDAQSRFFVDSGGGFTRADEVLSVGWLFTEEVEWTTPEVLAVTWTAPDRPGPLYVYALLGDGAVITGSWLRFEVGGP